MLTDDDMKTRLKKNQLNLPVLQCWYENLYNVKTSVSENQHTKNNKKVLVVIIPDFESFNVQVLQKFILIVSCYIRVLPFVFVFGIATSITTLHSSLPYKVSSKICVKVFKSQRSVDYLNNVLENVFFTFHCPFQLGGKVFNLFTDIFLFYDLSVNNFIQNIKFAVAEHFSYGNAMALCSMDKRVTTEVIDSFSHDDLENVRHLLSFRKLVEGESYENRIKILTDDDYFKQILRDEIKKLQKYIRRFHMFLYILCVLVRDLPKAPLGIQVKSSLSGYHIFYLRWEVNIVHCIHNFFVTKITENILCVQN
nr:origin recognition complex subunit 3-like [Leptinotarsa decemlineata]